MKRIWSIEEQHVNDNASQFGFTFASHPDAFADGGADSELTLTVYNPARDKKIVLTFDRNGQFVHGDVMANDVQEEAKRILGQAPAEVLGSEAVQDEAHHWDGSLGPQEPAVVPQGSQEPAPAPDVHSQPEESQKLGLAGSVQF